MKRSWRKPNPEATDAAERLVDELLFRGPDDIDLAYVAAQFGAAIVPEAIVRGHGASVRSDGGAIIAVDHEVACTPRGRFTLAHEIGHLATASDVGLATWCRGASGRFFQGEIDASDFAARMLAPTAFVARDPVLAGLATLDDVREFADRFRMSLSVALQRVAEMTTDAMAVVASRAGVITWWVVTDAFPFRITKGFPLGRYAHARSEETLAFHQGHGAAERVPARDWSKDRRAGGREVVEQSVGFVGGEAGAITLLRVER